MNKKVSMPLAIFILLASAVLACSTQATAIPVESTPTEIIPTEPIDTPTATLPPPTETPAGTPTPEPTPIPGTKFEVTSGDLQLNMEVPSCGILSLGFSGQTVAPLIEDDQLCLMSIEVLEGTPTQANVDEWVDSGDVYLLNRTGDEGRLIYASYNAENRTMLWIFSAPDNYAISQLQLLDQLIDLP